MVADVDRSKDAATQQFGWRDRHRRRGDGVGHTLAVMPTPVRPTRFVPVAQITAGTSDLPDWDTTRFSRELEELENAVDDRDADAWRVT